MRVTVDRKRIGWLLRGVALALVFAMAVHAFRSGVGVSDRAGMAQAPLLAHLYYAAGLFVLGGLDLGTPISGPGQAQVVLWCAYFLAPLITTSAVIEAGLKLLGLHALELFGLRKHVVLVGLGRLSNTFMRAMRQWDTECRLVALDRDVQRATVSNARREFGVRVFLGEANLQSSFFRLHLERSRGIALLTDNDLLNLEVAYRLARDYPSLPVVVHVSDVGLQRAAQDIARSHSRVRIFNAHRSAAEHLYTQHLKAYFAGTAPRDTVVLAGFGRFGQTIEELLERESGDAVGRVIVVDRQAQASMRSFRDQFSQPPDFTTTAVDGELEDPDTWNRVRQELGPMAAQPVFVVGAPEDGINLQSGIHVRRRWPQAPVFVRCQSESAFTEELARAHGLSVLAVNSLLQAALVEAQRDWLPASSRPEFRSSELVGAAGGE